jgi:hypothetical protein
MVTYLDGEPVVPPDARDRDRLLRMLLSAAVTDRVRHGLGGHELGLERLGAVEPMGHGPAADELPHPRELLRLRAYLERVALPRHKCRVPDVNRGKPTPPRA